MSKRRSKNDKPRMTAHIRIDEGLYREARIREKLGQIDVPALIEEAIAKAIRFKKCPTCNQRID